MADDPSPWRGAPGDTLDEQGAPGGKDSRSPWLPPTGAATPSSGGRRPQGLDDILSHPAFGPDLPKVPGSPRWWRWGALVLAGLWLSTGVHVLQQTEAGVVTRLGQYVRTLGPGAHLTAPLPIERVMIVPVRSEQTLSLGGAGRPLITADGSIAQLGYNVRWSVEQPRQYLFAVADGPALVKRSVEAAMTAEVARVAYADLGRDDVRSAIATRAAAAAQAALNRAGAGVRVAGVGIATVTPPSELAAAFEDVGKARTDADAAVVAARRETGEAVQRVRSDADAFNRVLVQYQAAPEVTRTRLYYEAMERILMPVPKTVVPAGSVVPNATPEPPVASAPATPVKDAAR